ncbi:MAG: CRISPR-associated helicase Cas3' [Bacteroidales bacterium]|nr:CRISPR-associated helicase Cas3' [Bacteroidales bacterium]
MNRDAQRLWAKSFHKDEAPPASAYLAQHLQDVYHAGEQVLAATDTEQLLALGLDPSVYRDRLTRCVRLAAAVHDLGKANDHFQGMIRGVRDIRQHPQGLRHEWATVLMLQHLRAWLLPAVGGNENDFAIVEWAVAGHHPAADHANPPRECPAQGGCGPEMQLLMGHPDFPKILDWFRVLFSLPESPPVLANVTHEFTGSERVFDTIAQWERQAARRWRAMRSTPDARLLAAVKNTLIAADIAGSALPKARPHDRNRWNWIRDVLQDKPQPGQLQEVAAFGLDGHTPRAFQTQIAASQNRVTFVKAGCGSGKTVAAYLWAARNHPTRRLYFCYPTTGTATEGFRDYLYDDKNATSLVGADLFHGRSDVDFEIILGTGRELDEEELRRDALRAWKTPVVACTVDTVLGIIQNHRRGLFGWPALSQAAFVFDEIHAFDDALFGALLRFLKELPGLPALLMTASLPQAREQALRAIIPDLQPISGPTDLEERPRYRRETLLDMDPLHLVQQALDREEKVLWVCNTVNRVMSAAASMATRSPCIYHSRFKYEDRVQRHKDVIAAFQHSGPALAICSQVAEMSLDLSADLLVTDLAPIPAMIQRLGRLNRRAKEPTRPFVVIESEQILPYSQDDLDAARTWLAKLPEDDISQRHLTDAWEQSDPTVPQPGASEWLDGGPATRVQELRQGSVGINVLMQEDRARVRAHPKQLPRLVLPMPPYKGKEWQAWPRERGLPIAPVGSIQYCPMRGAEWRK